MSPPWRGSCSMADSGRRRAEAMEAELATPLRLRLAGGGRAHVDRLLPFLFLNRGGGPDSLAARVAAISPTYVIWPGPEDRGAVGATERIALAAHAEYAQVLVVSL